MITIKHRGSWRKQSSEREREKFEKFNFTFNINYLFYLFKHRILIILNSPRVFPFSIHRSLWLFRGACCLTKNSSIYPSSHPKKRQARAGMMGAENVSRHGKLFYFLCVETGKVFFPISLQHNELYLFFVCSLDVSRNDGKSNKNSFPVILRAALRRVTTKDIREKQFSI